MISSSSVTGLFSTHRVCPINSEGQINQCFGREAGRSDDQLHDPWLLTIDRKRQIVFVAEYENKWVTMLYYNMTYIGHVKTSENFELCFRVFVDWKTDRLYVADWHNVGKSRLLIISPALSMIGQL